MNISIPSSSSNSYSFDLTQPSGLQFVATMYDSTGWGSGGTTSVLSEFLIIVCSLPSSPMISRGIIFQRFMCLQVFPLRHSIVEKLIATSNLLYDFFFSTTPQLPSNPSSCSSMTVTWDSNATRPIDLYGIIPAGSAFSLPVSQNGGTNDYDFTVDIRSGTQFLLLMSDDGPYQTGGSTGLFTVSSGGTSCINSTSPSSATTTSSSSTSASSTTSTSSSTSSSASASATSSVAGVGGASSGGTPSNSTNKTSTNTGAIAGGAVGGAAFLVLLGLLLLCCIRRRARNRRDSDTDPAIKSYGLASGAEKRRNPMDILGSRGRQDSDDAELGSDESPGGGRPVTATGENYEPSPFRYPSPTGLPGGTPPSSGSPMTSIATAATIGAGAGTLAGMSEKATQGSHATPQRPIASVIANSPRPSVESERTANTTGAGTNPTYQPSSGTTPPSSSAVEDNSRSDAATLGHSALAAPARHSSIRKTPSQPQLVPPSPTTRNDAAPSSAELARPLPDPPRQTTFVQHEDAGEVV